MTLTVPVYDLYGEPRRAGGRQWPEFELHCEEIRDRSRLHGWEIRPHRHAQYFQILYIASGIAELSRGDKHDALPVPCLLIVPAGSIHGFRFSRGVEGLVVTISNIRLEGLLGLSMHQIVCSGGISVVSLARHASVSASLVDTLQRIADEYEARELGWEAALKGHLAVALIESARLAAPLGDGSHDFDTLPARHLTRLAQLVERHYREHRPIGFYAGALGISPTHLNRLLRADRGTTVGRLLNERLASEARRRLAFGVEPVKTIALDLGFTDTAYFSRFFLREAGMSPTRYRSSQQDRETTG